MVRLLAPILLAPILLAAVAKGDDVARPDATPATVNAADSALHGEGASAPDIEGSGASPGDDEGSGGGFVDLTDDTVLSADPSRPMVDIVLPVSRRPHGPLFPSAIDGTAPRPAGPR